MQIKGSSTGGRKGFVVIGASAAMGKMYLATSNGRKTSTEASLMLLILTLVSRAMASPKTEQQACSCNL